MRAVEIATMNQGSSPAADTELINCPLIVLDVLTFQFNTMDNLTKFDRVPHGYPKLAALITKNEEFAIFKEFRWLNTQYLLYPQAELSALEFKLKEVDMRLKNENYTNTLRSYPEFVEDDEQRALVDQIRVTLKKYSEFFYTFQHCYNELEADMITAYCCTLKLPSTISMIVRDPEPLLR